MRIRLLTFVLLSFFSCKKSIDHGETKLLRTESTDYNGSVLHTEYAYDNAGRITTITQYQNGGQPVVAVTITYNGNEVTLLSHPDIDPLYDQTTEVHLSLDATGKMLKRIEYTHRVAKSGPAQPAERFTYDTLACEYNAAGLIDKATRNSYDSTWVNSTYNTVTHLTSSTIYTNDDGNLTASDEYAVYPRITRNGATTTVSGGSSEYHHVFHYAKSFPNHADFKNVAVLNEYAFYYDVFLNANYKNMPDQVIINNTDKDINGSVIFAGNATIDMERTYNSDGLLSAVNIPPGNTQFIAINYFYGK